MTKFNTKKVTRARITKNLAGGDAFRMSNHAELASAVLTSMLADKFYESSDARLKRIQELVAKSDFHFVIRLAVFARKVMHLRSVSHVLIGELIKLSRQATALNVWAGAISHAVYEIAERPDDLTEIAAYVGKPFTKQLKKGIRRALLKFDRYQLAKYQQSDKEFSLVDLFNLCHPKKQFATEEQAQAWDDLMDGKLKNEGTWESEISAAGPSDFKKISAWEKLIVQHKIGYMALLRNLNNLSKVEIAPLARKMVLARISSKEEIAKSKVLPFRFYTAWKNLSDGQFKDAVADALDISVSNAPTLKGNVLVALDVSSSMSGCMDKAAIIAASIVKNNKHCDFLAYDTSKRTLSCTHRTGIIEFVENAIALSGGGTRTDLVFETDIVYDSIVVVSDNQSWDGHVQKCYDAYKKRTGANPHIFAIDLEGYGTTDLSGGRVKHVVGFSERIFDFIEASMGGSDLVDVISDYSYKGYTNN